MGGKWSYICYFVGYCFHDLFNIARNILVHFLSRFFSMRFVSVLEVTYDFVFASLAVSCMSHVDIYIYIYIYIYDFYYCELHVPQTFHLSGNSKY